MAYQGVAKDNLMRLLYLLSKGKFGLIYNAYFNTIFDWKKLDMEIVYKLRDSLKTNDEGYLFDYSSGDLRVRTQINYLASIIKGGRVKRILETGTHNAMFCYLAYLCNSSVAIDTFGNLPESREAVNILNNKYGAYISYHLGDTRQTLSSFSPDYQIDFAWIDGGHLFEVCSSDLLNCARLGIPSITVDDYKWNGEVKQAVDEFSGRCGYSIQYISNLADYRGIAHLVKVNS